MEKKAPERWAEEYEITTTSREDLQAEITIMEENSQWIPGIRSSSIELEAIPSPIEASLLAAKYGMDDDKVYENVMGGTKLLMECGTGQHWNISGIARSTLYETAKLNGSSLSRMHQVQLSQNLNNSLDVARGTTLMLLRYDKVMALHSDAAGGYCVMPISKLLEIAERNLKMKFGALEFKKGYHSNAYTSALWELPDAQNDILDAYQKALKNAVSSLHAVNFMPTVRLSASDTARSSAILTPMFRMGKGTYFSLGKGIAVKHEKSTRASRLYGLDLFEEESKHLFSKFDESLANVKAMAETEIHNPVNCFVGICNHLNRGASVIPRKYADAAREEVERYAINCPIMSMHDIYLSMSECVSAAEQAGASRMTVLNIEEAIAKVLTLRWKNYDIGGTVAWGDTSKGA